MEKLIILDFCTGMVDVYPIDYDYEPNMEELLYSLDHRPNDCQWMFTQGEILFHKEVLHDEDYLEDSPLNCPVEDLKLPRIINTRFLNACRLSNVKTLTQFFKKFPTMTEFRKVRNIGEGVAYKVQEAFQKQFGINWKESYETIRK